MGAFKTGRLDFLSYNFYLLVVQADFFLNMHIQRSVSGCARSVSLGSAAEREWAPNKLKKQGGGVVVWQSDRLVLRAGQRIGQEG